jgi:hypothetical protein
VIDIDTSEVADLAKRMAAEAQRMEDAADRAIERGTTFLYSAALRSADAIRDTGELRDTLEMDHDSGDRLKSLARRVWSPVVQGVMQEFGTSRFPPQPWLYPHVPLARGIVNGLIAQAASKALEER